MVTEEVTEMGIRGMASVAKLNYEVGDRKATRVLITSSLLFCDKRPL